MVNPLFPSNFSPGQALLATVLPQIDLICYLHIRGGRVVEKGTRARDSILSGCRVFFLSECPDAISLGVVEKEYGVIRAGEGVGHIRSDACGHEANKF